MVIILVYIIGVVLGHYLLKRLIDKRRNRTDNTNRYPYTTNPLHKRESTKYMRWIWLWPVYVPFVFPVRFAWRGIKAGFTKLGFAEVYRDVADALSD